MMNDASNVRNGSVRAMTGMGGKRTLEHAAHISARHAMVGVDREGELNVRNSPWFEEQIIAAIRHFPSLRKHNYILWTVVGMSGPALLDFADDILAHILQRKLRESAQVGIKPPVTALRRMTAMGRKRTLGIAHSLRLGVLALQYA
jgi:hypothetical protein